jgi:hypothetical protein
MLGVSNVNERSETWKEVERICGRQAAAPTGLAMVDQSIVVEKFAPTADGGLVTVRRHMIFSQQY